jgi:hypothetical protein
VSVDWVGGLAVTGQNPQKGLGVDDDVFVVDEPSTHRPCELRIPRIYL